MSMNEESLNKASGNSIPSLSSFSRKKEVDAGTSHSPLDSGSMVDDILSVKDQVYHILERYPATRDSDKLLIMRYLVETKVGYYVRNGLFIPYSHFDDLPSFESIRRVRQKFQEQGLFPASKDVKELRELNEMEMHSVMMDDFPTPVCQSRLEV